MHRMVLALCVAGLIGGAASAEKKAPVPALATGPKVPRYHWSPEEIAIYSEGPALVTDRLQVEAEGSVQLVLPAATDQDSIQITDGGVEIPRFSIVKDPVARLLSGKGSMAEVKEGIVLEWVSPQPGQREASVQSLVGGINWRAAYRLDVLDQKEASLKLSFVVTNMAADLSGVNTSAVSGVTGVGASLRTLVTGGVGEALGARIMAGVRRRLGDTPRPDGYHTYALGKQDLPDDSTTNLALTQLRVPYTQRLEWNAHWRDQVTVVRSLKNTGEVPLPGGTVRVYERGRYVGADDIEWTSPEDEAEVGVEGASPVVVNRRTDVEEDATREYAAEYHHVITYEFENTSDKDQQVKLIDHRFPTAEEETCTLAPAGQDLEEVWWLVKLLPKQKLEVRRELYTDSMYTVRLAR